MIGSVTKILKKVFGDKHEKDISAIQPIVDQINEHFEGFSKLSHDELRGKSDELRKRIKDHISEEEAEVERLKTEVNEKPNMDIDAKEEIYDRIDKIEGDIDSKLETFLEEILPEAFAIVTDTARRFKENETIEVKATDFDRELATTRESIEINGEKAIWQNAWMAAGTKVTWNMLHYDVQLIGGVALHRGKVAEMQTGEGKTLVSTLPVFLNAITGRGVHLVTVNNYLAKRDSEWMGPIHEFHGLSVDCIDKHQPNSEERRRAYKCDVIYGTNNEFGFDYLRDNMAKVPENLVQRKHNYAIIDEVDSVLIDEARTPLIISGPTPKGDQHEFNELKPKIELLHKAQKQKVTELLAEAKKKLKGMQDGSATKEEIQEGSLALFRAFRGLPKNKAIIKFLSEEGVKQTMLKTEAFYMQDNSRDMWKADQELFFTIEEKNNAVELTEKGIDLISKNLDEDNFFIMPDVGTEIAQIENSAKPEEDILKEKDELMRDYAIKSQRVHTVNQLLKAYALFEKDVDYVVMDNKVKIVDEQTGRIMEGRRYSDGLHQAIESKEHVKVEAATQTYASVTLQNYFRMYNKLAGMTGTAETEAGELWDIYELDVMIIPTNKPVVRDDRQDMVFKTKREKYNAIIDEVMNLRNNGRPVLVGTTTVEVSELLSKMLNMREIPHQVLNAKMHQKEADIVAEAGKSGTVTIATNMAGRGTDIKLGEGVKDAGGLAIIGTERHDSRRVDRQLRGRAGRQGDPGSSQFYVSLEDDLMRVFGSDRIAKMMDRLGLKEGEVIQHSMITKSIERAQKKVEENNFGIRKRLLEFDDVMNSQREVIYKRRKHALFGERLKLDIANMFFDLSEAVILDHQANRDFENFKLDLYRFFGIETPFTEEEFGSGTADQLSQKLYEAASEQYVKKSEVMAKQAFPVIKKVHEDESNSYRDIVVPFTDGRKQLQVVANLEKAYKTEALSLADEVEKSVTLAIIDDEWKEHLRNMDDLRSNVQFAAHEQKDPLLIYKFESYELFSQMVKKVNSEVASFLVKSTLPVAPDQVKDATTRKQEQAQNLQTSKAGVQNLAESASSQRQGGRAPQQQKVKTQVRTEPKVGRNDPCPCGSGKKYKNCHGKA
jgi:preprotein translocase subunit SecA